MGQIGKTEDGVLIEIDVHDQAQRTAAGTPTKIHGAYSHIESVLTRITQPFIQTYRSLAKDGDLAEAKIELGLSFEAEGGIVIVKSKGTANLAVTLTFKKATKSD